LPDCSCCNIPKREIYIYIPNTTKYTKQLKIY
jgi:hypothetical protein